jgi:hypothetical protein
VLKEENYSGDGDLWREGRDEFAADIWGTHVLESRRNSLQDFNWVFSRSGLMVPTVKPSSDGQNYHHKGISCDSDEKEKST